VAHENLLNVSVCLEGVCDWLNLLVREHVLEQIQVSQWQDVEQVGECLSTYFVVVYVDVAEPIATLEHLDQLVCTSVVNLVV